MFRQAAFALLLSCLWANPGHSEEFLPLNDGLFVADNRLCVHSLEQMFDAYGDLIAVWTRTIDGTTYSTNYEASCTTQRVSRSGDNVDFTAICSVEGDELTENFALTLVSKDTFVTEGKTFNRCGSKAAAEGRPTTAELIQLAVNAEADCRGSSDPEDAEKGCAQGELLYKLLYARGICITEDGWSPQQEMWHVCWSELREE